MESILANIIALRDMFIHHSLFSVGMLLITGYFLGKLADKIKLPEITGYIIAGLLLGDFSAGIIHHEMSEALSIITDVALGLIALTIGGEFAWSKLKRMGKEVVIMTVSQIGLTLGAVFISLKLFGMEWPFALLMGAIATATAPAATVAIVQSLRAHGPFVDRLFGLVALDDAGCVVVFGISFAIVSGFLGSNHGGDSHAMLLVGEAFGEIFFSLLIGGIAGYLIHRLSWNHSNTGEIMIITLGFIFIETAIALTFHLSPLLSNMAAGTVLINMSPRNHRIFRILEPLTPPIYALFFAIAGTELNPKILMQPTILLLGFVFVISRAFGKYFGVVSGAILAKSKANIRKYLGFCMLPQAGVAIGLVLMIQASPMTHALPPDKKTMIDLMVNIVLLAVFVNELTGPPISKYAIINALESEE